MSRGLDVCRRIVYHTSMFSLLASSAPAAAMIEDPAGILAVLLAVLAVIFWLAQRPWAKKFFHIIPALVFCYFVPTTLTTFDILPSDSSLYDWIKAYILPAALFLLILSLDLPGILRLGPKAVIMLLSGTVGVVIGGPIALYIGQLFLTGDTWGLPPDAWQGLAALSGSWIGGGANFVAIGQIYGASDSMIATMVIPDVFVANIWMGVLLFCAGQQHFIDRKTGADASAIRALEQRLTEFQQRVARVTTLPDLMTIVALGFVASWLSYAAAGAIGRDAMATARDSARAIGIEQVQVHADEPAVPLDDPAVNGVHIGRAIDAREDESPSAMRSLSATQQLHLRWARIVNELTGTGMWKYVIVTTLALILSFTRVRNLEGAGASKVGSVMLYLLVASIGAHADFRTVAEAPGFIVVGLMWMAVHVIVLLTVAWIIKAPIFFVAVGSQANIGGAASAPIVAAAYHPSLAPVGVLLAVAGYVLGTYAGLVCGGLLKWVAT